MAAIAIAVALKTLHLQRGGGSSPPVIPEIEILTRSGDTILTRDGSTVIARAN